MKLFNKIKTKVNNKKVLNKDFSIISDNCWGNFMYQEVGMKYTSPFIGLFIYAEDYLKLLSNIEYYMKCEIKETDQSKWESKMPNKSIIGTYPIGVLNDDIEIHFMHYKNWNEAKTKWDKRSKRINYKNLYVKMSERALCSKEHIQMFEELPYKNKVCFTKENYAEFKSCIFLEKCSGAPYVQDEWKMQKNKFNIVKWLNSGKFI